MVALLWSVLALAGTFEVPDTTTQLIVGRTADWDSSTATLTRWQRTADGWKPIGSAVSTRIGREGLAWGRGLHPRGMDGPDKVEGDWRAPAGAFGLGDAYGYGPSAPGDARWPYHTVTDRDLWVEDPESPHYNRHIVLPDGHIPTDWEQKNKMRLGDQAHRLKLFVAHNAPPRPVSGGGSAIFFHVWRADGERPTSGCTAMPYTALVELISWLDPNAQPLYVLLTDAEYARHKEAWGLP